VRLERRNEREADDRAVDHARDLVGVEMRADRAPEVHGRHGWDGYTPGIASYSVNERAVARAKELIEARRYVLESEWGDVQPDAASENAYLESHSWEEYAEWHLGLTDGANDGTKARYAFVYGDLRRLHRTELIACVYRASIWRHKAIELVAHDLLQLLDRTSA
jgi:hypothetical protein